MSRRLTESRKKTIAAKQGFKCANKDSIVVPEYICKLWQNSDGIFDEAGYEIDHKVEFSITKDDSDENLQALCPMCHRVKTKRYNQQKKKDKPKTAKQKKTEMKLTEFLIKYNPCDLQQWQVSNYKTVQDINNINIDDTLQIARMTLPNPSMLMRHSNKMNMLALENISNDFLKKGLTEKFKSDIGYVQHSMSLRNGLGDFSNQIYHGVDYNKLVKYLNKNSKTITIVS